MTRWEYAVILAHPAYAEITGPANFEPEIARIRELLTGSRIKVQPANPGDWGYDAVRFLSIESLPDQIRGEDAAIYYPLVLAQEFGKLGWELISVSDDPPRWYFRRPVAG
jgi:hypothetical protein